MLGPTSSLQAGQNENARSFAICTAEKMRKEKREMKKETKTMTMMPNRPPVLKLKSAMM